MEILTCVRRTTALRTCGRISTHRRLPCMSESSCPCSVLYGSGESAMVLDPSVVAEGWIPMVPTRQCVRVSAPVAYVITRM
jgi:hypothetical protein